MIDCLTHGGAFDPVRDVAKARAGTAFRNFERMLSCLSIDVLVRFDDVRPDVVPIGAGQPDFIWFLGNRVQFEPRGGMLRLMVAQVEGIITEFRQQWPYAVPHGSGTANTNDDDATDFLHTLISRIANDTGVQATEAMARLVAGPKGSYAELIRHMAAAQRHKRAEEDFSAPAPADLTALLYDGPRASLETYVQRANSLEAGVGIIHLQFHELQGAGKSVLTSGGDRTYMTTTDGDATATRRARLGLLEFLGAYTT